MGNRHRVQLSRAFWVGKSNQRLGLIIVRRHDPEHVLGASLILIVLKPDYVGDLKAWVPVGGRCDISRDVLNIERCEPPLTSVAGASGYSTALNAAACSRRE
jgi:hypothetical protein